jgi:thiamine biosynthesis protein ThiS
MRIVVNGEERVAREANIAELLAALGAPQKGVAVERNRLIVPKSRYAAETLADGDEIEIVQFVGGG